MPALGVGARQRAERKQPKFDVLALDDWSTDFERFCKNLRKRIESLPFNKVFDLIQFVLRHPDNPVRFIDAFVDSLDLKEAGFQRVRPNDKGRPGYDPADLLKLYIYGYLNRVRSSRRLEVETHRNLEVIWLLRQLRPDFKTIADFRRDNRSAFRQVFREFVRLCRALDLYGRELIAVDGTRIKAVNNRDRNFTRAKLKRTCSASTTGWNAISNR